MRITPKPVRRGKLRLLAGQCYFTGRRYLKWAFGGIPFAKRQGNPLPCRFFSHQTPLLRALKDVDMRLQYNKITNLKLAVSDVSGITLSPGEVFSYWKAIGRPTRRRGYLPGMILQNGIVTTGIGGGLCQLSNLIYWMTLHTPLTVLERHRHGYDVFPDSSRTQPFGSGATCFYNYVDLIIKNNTDQAFQLLLGVTGTHLTGEWASDRPPLYTYSVYEKDHLIQQEFWGGYTRHNTIFRKKYNLENELVDDEFITENNAVMMYPPLLAGS